MEVFYCFTVAIGLPADASDHIEGKRSAFAARMQNKVVVEGGNSESYGDLQKQKISTWCFPFVNISTSSDRTEQSFQAVCFDFAQVKASAKLCMNMLSDVAVKSELKRIAKSLIVNSGNLKRRMVWLTRVCQVAWRFGRVPKD